MDKEIMSLEKAMQSFTRDEIGEHCEAREEFGKTRVSIQNTNTREATISALYSQCGFTKQESVRLAKIWLEDILPSLAGQPELTAIMMTALIANNEQYRENWNCFTSLMETMEEPQVNA